MLFICDLWGKSWFLQNWSQLYHNTYLAPSSSTTEVTLIEGPTLLTGMKNRCLQHFNGVVTAKICIIATTRDLFKEELNGAKKEAQTLIKSKEWKRQKNIFKDQMKHKTDDANSFVDNSQCVVS